MKKVFCRACAVYDKRKIHICHDYSLENEFHEKLGVLFDKFIEIGDGKDFWHCNFFIRKMNSGHHRSTIGHIYNVNDVFKNEPADSFESEKILHNIQS